ncbi:MAG: prepilin peptidase [bacterium]
MFNIRLLYFLISKLILYLIFFIFGVSLGSFANVCIFRIPLDKSIIKPKSLCPNCKKPLIWYDNIPILSFIILKGRCRFCSQKISCQYPIVELISGVVLVLLVPRYANEPLLLITFIVFFVLLLIISGIDYFHQIIPFSLSIPLIIVGLSTSLFNSLLGDTISIRIINSSISMVFGWTLLFAIGWVTKQIIRKEALGGGDPILLAGIGTFIGWKGVLITLFFSSLYGLAIMLFVILIKHRDKNIPFAFGPFLSAGAVSYLLFSKMLENIYFIQMFFN